MLMKRARFQRIFLQKSRRKQSSAIPRNEVGVQLLTQNLRAKIFPPSSSDPVPPSKDAINISLAHLLSHGLNPTFDPTHSPSVIPPPDLSIPSLRGSTIDEHFHLISLYLSRPYRTLAKELASSNPPPQPERWNLASGWTRYNSDGSFEPVSFPDEKSLVFDVETLWMTSDFAVFATAVSPTHWYAWVNPWITGESDNVENLIPLPPPTDGGKRLVVGHNVGFDRQRISEEYSLKDSGNRFLDTMALHVASNGLTGGQRLLYLAHEKLKNSFSDRESSIPDTDLSDVRFSNSRSWYNVSSLNSLADVAQLHCGIKVDKSFRENLGTFDRTMAASNSQDILSYCATDVFVTQKILSVLLPKFLRVCPHPTSFAGVLTMGSSFLPVDNSWTQYLRRAEEKYVEMAYNLKEKLVYLAEEARRAMEVKEEGGDRYLWELDPWLKQLDWSPKKARRLKRGTLPAFTALKLWSGKLETERKKILQSNFTPFLLKINCKGHPVVRLDDDTWGVAVTKGKEDEVKEYVMEEIATDEDKDKMDNHQLNKFFEEGFRVFRLKPFDSRSSQSKQSIPEWMKLKDGDAGTIALDKWATGERIKKQDGLNLFNTLRAKVDQVFNASKEEIENDLWLRQLLLSNESWDVKPSETESSEDLYWPKWYWDLDSNAKEGELNITVRTKIAPLLLKLTWNGYPLFRSKANGWLYRIPLQEFDEYSGLKQVVFPDPEEGVEEDDDLELRMDDRHVYIRVPHNDGDHNVGSPLTKPFLTDFENGTLASAYPLAAEALEMNAMCSYWISARDRIMKQYVIWKESWDEKSPMSQSNKPTNHGLILPPVLTMGTVTRRSVEKTWLTASNAKKNRIGSELKSMVRAPPGYAIVGADVDSEELWICSILGDAQFGFHGATALGWMTLEGTKTEGTDLHSKTASILGITRDGAKVFNYSRLYGAGIKHAVQLLKKANSTLTEGYATNLARDLYKKTKGMRNFGGNLGWDKTFWHGGSESYVFNTLERIASSLKPQTPTLGCNITEALSNFNVKDSKRAKSRDDFMPSRINWVVQSSGVDYLHMLIVSMEYLIQRYGIKARYMISVHDEIRYLVKEEDKYRAALALQISNIWTRSMFAFSLQMEDLPQSCAFFSAVDVDKYLRKEVHMTCETPSQPDALPSGESIDIYQTIEHTKGSLQSSSHPVNEDAPDDLDAFITTLKSEERWQASKRRYRENNIHFLTAQATSSKKEIKRLGDIERKKTEKEFLQEHLKYLHTTQQL